MGSGLKVSLSFLNQFVEKKGSKENLIVARENSQTQLLLFFFFFLATTLQQRRGAASVPEEPIKEKHTKNPPRLGKLTSPPEARSVFCGFDGKVVDLGGFLFTSTAERFAQFVLSAAASREKVLRNWNDCKGSDVL